MAFDFRKITAKKKEIGPIDPIDIFQKNKSKITDTGINDLWLGQGDALRDWHEHRDCADVAIVLNTGAGKTLIGLLVAQSLVNETKGKVIYACASIQLIEQTKDKAEGYGLKVTKYHSGEYSNDLFDKSEAVCLTTYQALFNGKSKFRNEDISAVIFDDAHAAEGMIKNHFSLNIKRNDDKTLFVNLLEVFRSYFKSVGRDSSFKELLEGRHSKVELLPPSQVIKNIAEIQRILNEADVSGETNTMFAWEHLKDHLDLCAYLVANNSIEIIPPFIPVSSLSYFQSGIRRVYLSATMLGTDSFIRTFGKELGHVVEPDTPAGQCERLIIFPEKIPKIDDAIASTKVFLEDRKALILTPNYILTPRWEDIADSPTVGSMVEDLESFKASRSVDKLVLTARYDGIDLPGDTCRHLILDGLPTGAGLLDRYMWESLKLSNILRSTIACRIVQSLGRISRGMSDHGVVIVLGREYVRWLLTLKNQAYLPPFVQKQIKLGFDISEKFSSPDDIKSTADSCLTRDHGWINAYQQFMEECETESVDQSDEILCTLARVENKFIEKYWNRDYQSAIKLLENILTDAFNYSPGISSWYELWIGCCFELLDDRDSASVHYKKANGATKNIPRYVDDRADLTANPVSSQVLNISNEFLINKNSLVSTPKNISSDLAFLNEGGTVSQTEEALRHLGQYLGLDSTRPDKEHGTGPDVLWLCDGVALVLEAKTDKKTEYKKDNVGQLSDHMQWVDSNHEGYKKIPVFVGPLIGSTEKANPSEEVLVIELSEFKKLGEKLIAVYEDIVKRAIPITLNKDVETVLKERLLTWPELLDQIEKHQLINL